MRIVHLLNHTCRLSGNVHAAVDLACAQADLGHTVCVASGGGDFDEILARHGVATETIDHKRRPLNLARATFRLLRFVRAWKPDVVHAHMMTSALIAAPVTSLSRRPLVTTVHNAFEKSATIMGFGDRVIAVSDVVRETMAQRGIPARKLRVVLNGTIGSARNHDRKPERRQLAGPSIVFVGGLHPRKGITDLLAAFDLVHARHPQARLYLVGEGPHGEEYARAASSLPCRDAVVFCGPQDDPFSWMIAADIFVLPSHADPAPLVISEAREAGCAVIGTGVDGIPQLLEYGEAGIIVPPKNPEAMAAALDSLLASPATLAEWRRASQVRIEAMEVRRVAEETLAIYRDAVGA